MTKLTLILSLLFITISSFAQEMRENVEIDFGSLKDGKTSKIEIVDGFKIDDGYIIIKKEVIKGPGGWHYFIEKFDENLQSVELTNISQQFEDDGFILGKLVKLKDKYVLFSQKSFELDKEVSLYAQTLDWNSTDISAPELLHTMSYEKRVKWIPYDVNVSHNKEFFTLILGPVTHQKVLIMWQKIKFSKGFTFKVFDNDLTEQWIFDDFQFDEEGYEQFIIGNVISDNGIVFLLTKKRKEGRLKKGEDADISYQIHKMDDDGLELLEDLDFEDKMCDEIALVLSKSGDMYVGGYYRIENGRGIEGSFLMPLDKNEGTVEEKYWSAFSQEFILARLSDKQAEKTVKKTEKKGIDLGINNLYFIDVIQHNDGTLSMVGELFWITTHTTTDANGNMRTRTVYHYGDLIISRLAKDNENFVYTRFRKHHTYSGAYIYFNLGNELGMMMAGKGSNLMDHDEFRELPKSERKKLGYPLLFLTTVSADGEVKKEGILDYREGEHARYRKYLHLNHNSIILENEGNTEVLVTTYFGKKMFGFGRFRLNY